MAVLVLEVPSLIDLVYLAGRKNTLVGYLARFSEVGLLGSYYAGDMLGDCVDGRDS